MSAPMTRPSPTTSPSALPPDAAPGGEEPPVVPDRAVEECDGDDADRSRSRSLRGFMARIARASVRDLVIELARIEDELRTSTAERAERNRLLAREGCIIAELRARRRRFRTTVAGPVASSLPGGTS